MPTGVCLPLVIGLAALLFIDGALRGEGDVTALAVGTVALATASLLWRRRAPRVVLLALVAGVFACLATLVPEDVIGVPLTIGSWRCVLSAPRC